MLLLEDIVFWVIFTFSTTCFIEAKLGDTLSSKTSTLFSPKFPPMWCNLVRLVQKWDSYQSQLTGIETNHLLAPAICWLICRHERTIECVIVQTPDLSLKFSYPALVELFNDLNDEHRKFLYSSKVPISFPQMQKSCPSVLPKRVHQVSVRMRRKSFQMKPAKP